MDGSVNVGDVLKILDKERPTLCNNIILCGYYHPKDSTDVNVSFRMTYQDDHETLSMEVVNDIHKTFAEEVIAILPCRFP